MPNENTTINPGDERMERDARARQAGEILYRNSTSSSFSNSNRNYGTYPGTYPAIGQPSGDEAYTRDYIENKQLCCGPMSPVRRNFCLLLLFDFILSFLLWLIYTQIVKQGSLIEVFKHEMLKYTFTTSLFDTVLCSAWRFVPLLLAYALFRLSRPWPVALTTLGTCVFLIAKVFTYEFNGEANHGSPLCYVLMLVSFILAWVETWFLDFKVLPREKRARELALSGTYAEHSSLLHSGNYNQNHRDEMLSLPYTPLSSDDEDDRPVDFHSMPTSKTHSRRPSHGSQALSLCSEEQEYMSKALDGWERAATLYEDREGWHVERGDTLDEGIISTKTVDGGKVYRLEAYVDCSQQMLFETLVKEVAKTPQWNPTVADAKVLQVIDDCTDIHYTVASESAGGLVSSRDFVNVRHWKHKGGVIISAGCAVVHPDAPADSKKHVRGENRPGSAWIFAPVEGNPNRCVYCWLMSTDIKGWIPQWTIDQALVGTIKEFLEHLRTRVKNKSQNNRSLQSV